MASMLSVVILSCALQVSASAEDQTFTSLTEQARAEYVRGHFAQSEVLFIAALRALPSLDQTQRAHTLSELGDVYANEDELPKAEHAYRQSLEIYKKVADKTKSALLLRHLGAVYSLQGRDEDALSVLREALKAARAAPEADASFIAQVLNGIGVVYYRKGKLNKAEDIFNEAVKALPNIDGLYVRADLLNNLGAIYLARHDFKKAEEYLTRALNITEGQVGPAHPDLTFQLSSLGTLYTDTGRYAKAEEQFQRALAILAADKNGLETRTARLLHQLSRTYVAAGRLADARLTLFSATTIARRNVAQHPDMALIMDEYAERLKIDGKQKEADELRVEAKRARVAAGLVINAHSPF